MMLKKAILKSFSIAMLIALAACAGGPRVKMAPGYAVTPTQVQAQSNVMGTPEPTKIPPTPTPQPLSLDNAAYSLTSKALSFKPPLGWMLSSEYERYARFEAPDKQAWMEAAVESSGYSLEQSDFETYVHNMLASLYRGADSYNLLDSQIEESKATYSSSFVRNGSFWFEYDVFIQRGSAIYSLSFQTLEMLWEAYLPGFRAVVESAATNTGYVKADMIYSFMRTYTSPKNQFTLTIPMGWTFTFGQDTIKNAVLDTAVAPDGQAAVEVVAYDGSEDLKTKDVGQISIPILKQLEDQNLRIRSTDLLNDGRIRVNWQIDAKGMRGYSFFWQDEKNVVYILTLKYADKYAGTYKEVNDNIGDSFNFVAAGS